MCIWGVMQCIQSKWSVLAEVYFEKNIATGWFCLMLLTQLFLDFINLLREQMVIFRSGICRFVHVTFDLFGVRHQVAHSLVQHSLRVRCWEDCLDPEMNHNREYLWITTLGHDESILTACERDDFWDRVSRIGAILSSLELAWPSRTMDATLDAFAKASYCPAHRWGQTVVAYWQLAVSSMRQLRLRLGLS